MAENLTTIRTVYKQDSKEGMQLSQKHQYSKGDSSPARTELSAESTTCLFSGKKRKRNLSRSGTKQRYLKTNASPQLDFESHNSYTQSKSK